MPVNAIVLEFHGKSREVGIEGMEEDKEKRRRGKEEREE